MAEPLKFTFNTAFGTRSENQELNVELPVITQDEVDAARTQGFIQGREDGLTEATEEFNSEFNASLEALSGKLDAVLSEQAATAQMAIEQAQNYALLIAQKISKAALTEHPTKQIIALIEDCLSHINLMPHLVIRVHQSLSQLTKDELQPIIERKGFEGKLIILGEEDIPLGDCMVEWADGGVAHNTQEIVQTISNRLVDYFGFDVEAVPAEIEPDLSLENDDLLDENVTENDENIIENDEDKQDEETDMAAQAELSPSPLDETAIDDAEAIETTVNDIPADDTAIDDTEVINTIVNDIPADETAMAEPTGLEGQIDE